MENFSELYDRYVKEHSDHPKYVKKFAVVSEQDLLDNLIAILDGILNDYGTFEEYADLTEPEMVFDVYSISEAIDLSNYLTKKLAS